MPAAQSKAWPRSTTASSIATNGAPRIGGVGALRHRVGDGRVAERCVDKENDSLMTGKRNMLSERPSPVSLVSYAETAEVPDRYFSPDRTHSDDLDEWENDYAEVWFMMTGLPPPDPDPGAELPNQIGVGSPAWYCARSLLCLIARTRIAKERGDVDDVIDLTFMLAYLMSEFDIVFHNRDAIEMGAKLAPKFASGRGIANADRKRRASSEHRRWITEARAIWRRNPRHSVSACARIIIKSLTLPAKTKTVADAIRHLKKVGGAS